MRISTLIRSAMSTISEILQVKGDAEEHHHSFWYLCENDDCADVSRLENTSLGHFNYRTNKYDNGADPLG